VYLQALLSLRLKLFQVVLIPNDEIFGVPFSEVKGRHSVCTNIEHDSLAKYRGNIDSLKSGIEVLTILEYLQIKRETHPEFTFID
jgi:hypothetical protein